MSAALTVARRELAQLFHSPLAYVFLVLFVAIVQLPYVLVVFLQGQADLRMFFDTLPWCIVLFASLVTMRSWAEERQENTYEMLLTFPVRERALVAGKFLAAFAFMLTGLAGTLTLPVMLEVLGAPDGSAILAGYGGAVFLAAMWCAAGVFFSSLSRSQLLAAIVTMTTGLASLLLGTETGSTLLDARFGGVGTLFETMIGCWSHYGSFAKGVIELADIAYFAAWTGAFLWLNTLVVGLRRTPGSAAILAVGTPLAIGCAMLTGRLSAGSSWARADMTEDGLYTLSPGTVRILSRAKVPVRVTYYVSPRDDMPKEYQALERQVMDRLREIEVASGGRLVARAAHAKPENLVTEPADELGTQGGEDPEKEPEKRTDKEKSLEKRLSAKGVRPFAASSIGTTETSTRLVYSTLAIRYREKDEEFLQPIVPERLGELEYLLANTVARLVRDRAPKIALHTGKEPLDPQTLQAFRQQRREPPDPYSGVEQLLRREKFDVERVALTAHEPMPEDYDALVVIGPTELDERQKYEIDRALAEGRPTLLAVQRYTWDYKQTERRMVAERKTTDPGLDDLLAAQGLGVSRDVLMDDNQVELRVRTGGLEDMFGGSPVRLPTHVLVKEGSMNRDSVLTERQSSVLYLWGTPLTLDEAKLTSNGISVTTLFTSGPKSWTANPEDRGFRFAAPPAEKFAPSVLAVLAKGQFQSVWKGKPRPAWPMKIEDMMQDGRPRPAPPDTPERELRPAPGQVLLLGCARMWQNGFAEALGDASFLLNALDALTLDEDLLLVRSKQPTDRRFDKPTDRAAVLWSAIPLGGVPFLIVVVGLVIGAVRHRRRETWEREHGR